MTNGVKVNYDGDGREDSVLVPYLAYLDLIAARDECDGLKEKLRELVLSLSHFLDEHEPAVDDDAEIEDEDITDPGQLQKTVSNDPFPSAVDILYYQRARGYWDRERRGFLVVAGSKARGYPSETFNKNYQLRAARQMRELFISIGSLVMKPGEPDYTFIRDCTFNSPSQAASVVDGNSRSGNDTWHRK